MHKEYVYAGGPIPELDIQEHTQFLIHLEKAILYSLAKRSLINRSQRDRCFAGIDNLHAKEKHQA